MKYALMLTAIMLTACGKSSTTTPTAAKDLQSNWQSEQGTTSIDLSTLTSGSIAWTDNVGDICQIHVVVNGARDPLLKDPNSGVLELSGATSVAGPNPSVCGQFTGNWNYYLLENQRMLLCSGSTCNEFQ